MAKEQVSPSSRLQTGMPGGIRNVTAHDLEQMQKGNYILHAHDRLLTKIPIQKIRLPHDPQGHIQRVTLLQSPDRMVYVKQHTLLCKSGDDGKTWTSSPIAASEQDALWQVRAEPFALRVRGVGHFSRKGRASALWAAFEFSEGLAILQRRIERACRAAGLVPETRKFIPHITIARLNASAGPIEGWLARNSSRRTFRTPCIGSNHR